MTAALAPDVSGRRAATVDLPRTLAWYRYGAGDPTTRIGATSMARACWTAGGPASVVLDWSGPTIRIDAWGPGRDHARCSVESMMGADRVPVRIAAEHRLLHTASRRFESVRTGSSGDLYHALLPTILAQRITSGEAVRQWARLCSELGEAPPGPDLGLLLPPRPERLAGRPAWWFHPLGIEAKRARTLTEVGRIAERLWQWVRLPLDELAAKLVLVRGIGPWTVGSVLGPVCGDDDAVAVGDYHLPNLVAWNLAGEARADDTRMLALLEPFRGQRRRTSAPVARSGRGSTPSVRPSSPDPAHVSMVTTPTPSPTAEPTEMAVTAIPPLVEPTGNGDAHDGPSALPSNGAVVITKPVRTPAERRAWYRAVAIGLAAFAVSRLCVLAGAGVRASQVTVDANVALEPRPGTPLGLVTGVFTQWDGLWYLEIVRSGYPRSIPPNVTYFQLEARAAFFPMYPMLVRAVDRVLPGGDTMAALFINLVLAVVALVLVGILARRLYDVEVAERAMVLFAVFPGSFVLSWAYAETLLIVLAALCFWLLMEERWLLAGIVAALASATRPNGVALVAACAIAALIAIKQRRQWKALVAPLLAPVGFIAFQAFLAAHTGESWPWFRVQREAWREGTSFGATAISNTLSFLGHPLASPTDALTAASLAAMLLGLWCLWRKPLPWPMIAYVAVVIGLMLLPSTVTARPRFLFTAFPLFISAAAWWPRKDRVGWDLMLVASGAGLVTLTMLYGVFGAIP